MIKNITNEQKTEAWETENKRNMQITKTKVCRQQKPKFSMDCKHQNFTEGTAWTKQIKLIKQKNTNFLRNAKYQKDYETIASNKQTILKTIGIKEVSRVLTQSKIHQSIHSPLKNSSQACD